MVRSAVVLSLAGLVLAAPAGAWWDERGRVDYDGIVRAELAKASIEDADVTSVAIEPYNDERREARVTTRVDGWVRLASCERGALVVSMAPDGRVIDVFTRGGCNVAGVSGY